MKHVSLDIETMSSRPDAAVVGVGARVFDTAGLGKGFEAYISQSDASRIGMVSMDTMAWWAKQPAYSVVFGGKMDAATAAKKLSEFFEEHKPEYVWANGPQFDCVILRNWFAQVGLKCPWHYRAERDFRTIRHVGELLQVDTNNLYDGTAHTPLDDATNQARVIGKVLESLSRPAAPAKSGRGPRPSAPSQLDLDLVAKI